MSLVVGRRMSRALWAGATLALALGVSAQAWAQEERCARISGSVQRDAVPQATLHLLENPNATDAELGIAIADCSARTNSIGGNLCSGRAELRRAVNGDRAGDTSVARDYYTRANDHFCHAQALARRANDNSVAVDANVGRAEALLGLIRFGGATQDNFTRLDSAHHDAGDQNSQFQDLRDLYVGVHVAIAQRFLEQRNQSGITAALNEARRHLQGHDLAGVLTQIAIAQDALAPGSGRATFGDAITADSRSVRANAEYARSLVDQKKWNEARPYLVEATRNTPPPVGDELAQQDSFYFLSALELSRRDFDNAGAHADLAGNTMRALSQACLARVKWGRTQVYDTDREGHEVQLTSLRGYDRCTSRLASSPEGQLARGMFWLRRAQYLPAPTLGTDRERVYRDALDNAMSAFNANVSPDAPLGWVVVSEDATPTTLSMPKLQDMLTYGRTMAAWFGGFCRSQRPQDVGGASEVFRYYGIDGCVASNQR